MADIYSHNTTLNPDPAVDGFAITPNDTIVFAQTTRSIYVGGGGNVSIKFGNKAQTNSVITFTGVPAAFFLPVRAQSVMNTGTTATGIIGLF